MPLTLLEFVRKWNASLLTERSSSQQHFRDLCEALGVPHPTELDEIGNAYCFDKRVTKLSGGEGFADVWKRGYFAWEYKSKEGDLKAAYRQLSNYHEALENPPLLVVCDFVRFEVHTKFENAPTRVYAFTLDDLLLTRDTPTCSIPPIEVLRAVFGDFNELRPERTAARITRAAASDLLRLAEQLELETRPTPLSREQIAHFLMRIVFCLFADSIGLLPEHTFRNLVLSQDQFLPRKFRRKLKPLFQAMSEPDGIFGPHTIPYFNGGLFEDDDVIELDLADLAILASAARHNWAYIEPTIFGTLFERSLDAAKRSLIGAHYTSTEDILLLIEPVVMTPLKRRWESVRAEAEAALEIERQHAADANGNGKLMLDRPSFGILSAWIDELNRVTILDPACGSGNFLYVALRRLLDLWYEAQRFATTNGLSLVLDPMPNPQQLFGIETDFYAHEIASVVVWIGFLQWKHEHGIRSVKEPLLQKLDNIEKGDAILRYDADGKPYEPEWQATDFIVGNPPFLGGNRLRKELGDAYVDDLFGLYNSRVEPFSDLVCYWFEKARAALESKKSERVGLLATQGIRGGANRSVLHRIKQTGDIFCAYSDRNWILQGAAVHISIIMFDLGTEQTKTLDGIAVDSINANLTSGEDVNSASTLAENFSICFMGPSPKGEFDISSDLARKMLNAPLNVNGRPNSDVLKPVLSGVDITGRSRGMWTIDFGLKMAKEDAAHYELPFEYLRTHSLPLRSDQRESYRKTWWLYGRPRPEMRKALAGLDRFIATPATAKHRVFVWVNPPTICNQGTLVYARQDDYFFGVLHSRVHELWARAQGTQLREVESGFRYTPDSTFDTFPFPYPPNAEPRHIPAEAARMEAIAAAARNLVHLRDAWLNPPDTPESELKKRTLTNLYNARPTWLADAHRALDEAVFAAYGWPANLSNSEILSRLLAHNHERAAASSATAGKLKAR